MLKTGCRNIKTLLASLRIPIALASTNEMPESLLTELATHIESMNQRIKFLESNDTKKE